MPDDDFLQGTEAVARAFHKHLRGKLVRIDIAGKDAYLRLGNYVIKLTEVPEGGEFEVKDVSGAS